jgi:hypothetical protein
MKMKKNMLGLAAILAVLAVLTPRAWAVNTQDALTAEADKTAFSALVVGGAGNSDLAHIYYTGASSEAVVTIAATHMDFFAPAGTAEATAASTGGIGTLGVVTYASTLGANNMGSLCDYINSTKYYSCQLTGALRGDAPVILKTQTETSGTCQLNATGGCKLTNNAADIIRLGIIPNTGRRVILKSVQSYGVSATDTVDIYGILRPWNGVVDVVGNSVTADTKVWSSAVAGASTLGYAPASSQYVLEPWIEFMTNNTPMSRDYGGRLTHPVMGTAYDGRVVISMGTTGDGNTETSADYLRVIGIEK